MMVDRVIAPDLPKWQAPKERALAVRSLSALLGDVPTQLPFGAYGSLWCVRLSLARCSAACIVFSFHCTHRLMRWHNSLPPRCPGL